MKRLALGFVLGVIATLAFVYEGEAAELERWPGGGPLVLTLQPVDFTPEHMDAAREAADEWNATGYTSITVLPSIADDPNTTDPPNCGYGCVPLAYEPLFALGATGQGNGPDGYIAYCTIWINPTVGVGDGAVYPAVWYFTRVLAHETGHCLGLPHNDEYSVMGNWTIPAPTPYDIATLDLRYPLPPAPTPTPTPTATPTATSTATSTPCAPRGNSGKCK